MTTIRIYKDKEYTEVKIWRENRQKTYYPSTEALTMLESVLERRSELWWISLAKTFVMLMFRYK